MAWEWGNILFKLGNYTISVKTKVMGGLAWRFPFSKSVTDENTGFATIDYATCSTFRYYSPLFLMFYREVRQGTAGGIKTTTFACNNLIVINEIRGQNKH